MKKVCRTQQQHVGKKIISKQKHKNENPVFSTEESWRAAEDNLVRSEMLNMSDDFLARSRGVHL